MGERDCQVSFGTDALLCRIKKNSREYPRTSERAGKAGESKACKYSITKTRNEGNAAIQSTKSIMRKASPTAFS